jgi:hypothetical protein
MTDKSRPWFLRAERWIYGVSTVVLMAAIVATAYSLVMVKTGGDCIEFHLLMESRDRIWDAMLEEYRHRTDDVVLYPPPANEAGFPVWVNSIQSHVGFPAAVFLWQDTTIRAVSVPEHLRGHVADLSRIVNPATPRGQRMKPDTVGSMILWEGNTKVDTLNAHVKAFQRLGDKQAWGVLYRFDDARLEMAGEILAYDPHNLLASRPWVPRITTSGDFSPFRVLKGDSVIAATKHLDTSHSKYAERGGQVRFEYYLDDLSQMNVNLLLHPRLLHFLLCVEVAMLVVLGLFHRWIRKLSMNVTRSG